MLDIIFYALMILVFGRLVLLAIKMAWGIGKVIATLVCLPVIILFAFFKGLLYLCWPVLLIVLVISLFTKK